MGDCATALFTFGLFFIEIVVNLLLRQRDWLPFEVAMSLETTETAKLEKNTALLFAKLEEGKLLSKYMDAFCI